MSRFMDFFRTRSVHFEAFRFEQNFHLVRFPSLTEEDVHDLLDQFARVDYNNSQMAMAV